MLGSQGKHSSVNETMKLPNYRYVMGNERTPDVAKRANGEDAIAYLGRSVTASFVSNASFVMSQRG